jgi:hypothetical protein
VLGLADLARLPASSAVMSALGGICGATQPMLAPSGTLPTRSAVRLNALRRQQPAIGSAPFHACPPSQRQREPKRPSILDGWPGAPTAVALGLPIEDVCSREPLRSSPASREPGRDSRAKSRPPGSRGEGFQGSLVGLAPDYIVPANAALRGARTPSSWRTRSRWNQGDRGSEPRLMPLP